MKDTISTLLTIFVFAQLSFGTGITAFAQPLSAISHPLPSQRTYILSTAELMYDHPQKVRALFAALDCELPALNEVTKALRRKDTVAACDKLLEHFRQVSPQRPAPVEAPSDWDEHRLEEANTLLNDTVTVGGVRARVPRAKNGGWTWTYTGPDGDQEFGYSMNNHRYLLALLRAYLHTKREVFAAKIDNLIQDWIIRNPLPAPDDSIYLVLASDKGLDYRDIGEVRWRTLEAGNRVGESWSTIFYGLQESKAFAPATRLLMLASIAEHAEYLKRYHKRGHNWTTMEMNGLAVAGLYFPEFREADAWATYALDVMKAEIGRQVYPDGVQKELSTKTQWVALSRFEAVAEHFKRNGRDVPPTYITRLEEMYNYLAWSMRPDGHQPLNNDSDREDLRERVLAAAKKFNRRDWEWIATNGQRGERPAGHSSVVFPWAGINVFRNGWQRDGHWAFFDAGPFGTGHQHADKLHISLAAFGRDLLVDGGRYTHEDYFSFDPRIWRGYFRSSLSHNVVLVDGSGQNGGALTVDKPLQDGTDYRIGGDIEFARGHFKEGYRDVEGRAEHTRVFVYLKDQFWIVVDRIASDRPRDLQALWHYSPDCNLTIEGTSVVSTDPGKANLRIVPVGGVAWKTRIIKGQTEPVKQGWYSAEYGVKVPNSTAQFSADIPGSATFAWILYPANGPVPDLNATVSGDDLAVKVVIKIRGEKERVVLIPVKEGEPQLQDAN